MKFSFITSNFQTEKFNQFSHQKLIIGWRLEVYIIEGWDGALFYILYRVSQKKGGIRKPDPKLKAILRTFKNNFLGPNFLIQPFFCDIISFADKLERVCH